jgi:GNAT superfamily N-acetyltransferase
MYVRPKYQGRGIGRVLGEQIIHEARRRGCRVMRLDTEISLAAARQLYLSLGFRPTRQYCEVPPDMLKRTIFMELAL